MAMDRCRCRLHAASCSGALVCVPTWLPASAPTTGGAPAGRTSRSVCLPPLSLHLSLQNACSQRSCLQVFRGPQDVLIGAWCSVLGLWGGSSLVEMGARAAGACRAWPAPSRPLCLCRPLATCWDCSLGPQPLCLLLEKHCLSACSQPWTSLFCFTVSLRFGCLLSSALVVLLIFLKSQTFIPFLDFFFQSYF